MTIIQTGNEKWSFNVNSDEWSWCLCRVEMAYISSFSLVANEEKKLLYIVKFLIFAFKHENIFSLAGGKHTVEKRGEMKIASMLHCIHTISIYERCVFHTRRKKIEEFYFDACEKRQKGASGLEFDSRKNFQKFRWKARTSFIPKSFYCQWQRANVKGAWFWGWKGGSREELRYENEI